MTWRPVMPQYLSGCIKNGPCPAEAAQICFGFPSPKRTTGPHKTVQQIARICAEMSEFDYYELNRRSLNGSPQETLGYKAFNNWLRENLGLATVRCMPLQCFSPAWLNTDCVDGRNCTKTNTVCFSTRCLCTPGYLFSFRLNLCIDCE